MSESILNKLLDEHQSIKEKIVKIMKTQNVEQKKDLFLGMKEEIILHMDGEEKSIYHHLIEDVGDEEAEEIAHDAENEHEAMRNLMDKLDNIGIESDEWDATFRDLRDHFLDHIAKEETSLFDEAKEDFSQEELIEFGNEYEEAKLQSSL
jgi:hypothetical protein